MTYKYETLKEIKELPKYKQLVKQLKETFKSPTTENKSNLFPLYEWYINSCFNCKEFQEQFNKEYYHNFVDVNTTILLTKEEAEEKLKELNISERN